MSHGGYQRARDLLSQRFGDKYAISSAWVNKVTSDSQKVTVESLQQFADELLSFRETLNAIDCLSEINLRVLVQIATRLPIYLQHRWKREASKLRERAINPSIDDLVRFIQSAASDPVFGDLGVSHKPKPVNQVNRKTFHGATEAETRDPGNAQKERQCPACQSGGCQSLFK